MGGAKDMMFEHEQNLALAAVYLVKVGFLQKCEFHEEVFGGGSWELETDFWRNAMADRNRGERGPISWAGEMEAREFTDILKAAYEEYCGDECGWCAKRRAE